MAESEVAERLNKVYLAKETKLYDRLGTLFQAMDKGDPVLNVPTYNGGLFNVSPDQADHRDARIARFLLDHKVPDRYLALAIDRLSRDQDERTLALVFIDYKSLEVRHLGSIYEGLLEFKLKVAEEDLTTQTDKKGEKYVPLSQAKPGRRRQRAEVVVRKKDVYLSNDKAERKASGSYYTPDPIVEYIVAHTVGSILDEKLDTLRDDFRKVRKTFNNELQKSEAYPSKDVSSGKMDHRQWAGLQTYNHHKDLVEKLFDLRVLDPAMGSGHFLVEVVDFVTDRLLKFLNQFPINPVNFALDRTRQSILESLSKQGVSVDPQKLTDINLLKRHALKRCVYGVDLNPMAVELAKVSLWLDAFTLGAPLNFLDHHLRCGNSLIGATFQELEKETTGRAYTIDMEPLLRAINQVVQVSRLSDATAAEAGQSSSLFAKARESLSGYALIFDCVAGRHFGFDKAYTHIVLSGHGLKFNNEQAFRESLDDEDRTLLEEVETLARQPDRRFFHWEIEFPEVFFGFVDANERQIKHKDKIAEGSAGFDCVVGNPPYGPLQNDIREFVFKSYQTGGGKPDIYAYFIEQASSLVKNSGRFAFVTPNTWLTLKAFSRLRSYLLERTSIVEILDTLGIFEDAWVNTAVVTVVFHAKWHTE